MIAEAVAGPFAAACVLLALAGLAKIRRPLGTRPAAAALGLPASGAAIRTLGVVETVAALAGLAIGGVGAVAVALVYTALSLAAWRLFVHAPGTACGCLGAANSPVTRSHLVVNVAAVVVAALAASGGSPFGAGSSGAWTRVTFLVLAGCCVALVSLLVDALPQLHTATREGQSR